VLAGRGEERLEFRPVERLAVHVGIDLHAERAVLERALRLAHAGVGHGERGLRHPAGIARRVLGADLGEAVIDQLEQVLELVGLGEMLERRHRIGEDLRVVRKAVDHLVADVEVEDRRHAAHALADVLVVAGDLLHAIEKFFRDEVGVRVQTHSQSPIDRSLAAARPREWGLLTEIAPGGEASRRRGRPRY
jgi:hypothetical protein